jgi:transglutaminase-like putative cysteine protease/predicted Zn-dependent protease
MPKRYLLGLLLTYLFNTQLFANDYEDAWKALDHNDRKTARQLLLKAMNDPHTAVDAYITYIYLESFDGKETDDFISRLYNQLKDPNPYIYSLWFNEAALGNYGKKDGHQLELLNRLIADTALNGSIHTAAHYFKALHYEFSNDLPDAKKEWAKMGAVDSNWQLAGPFDNLSGSGYYKDYGPLGHPEADARFASFNNAMITWFTPTFMGHEGYTFPHPHVQRTTAIVYAQTFVYSPDDRRVLINVGAGGSIKVWVNDRPVLAASKELTTELDFYRQSVQLKKGYNRLLIQLGYTSTNAPNFIIRFTDDRYNAVGDLTYSAAVQAYPKETAVTEAPPSIKHFAEDYFEKKVAAEPGNYVNYVLLADTYLRNSKVIEGRKVIETALQQSPDNPILRAALMGILIKEKNRTLLLEEAERMKDKDPDCLLAIRMNIQQLIREEKYDEAFRELDRCTQLYGDDEESWTTRMTLYSKQNKMDELVKAIQTAYDKYPDNADMVQWMYSLKVNGYKDDKAGIKVLEDYLKDHFNFQLMKTLTEEYTKEGEKEKALALMELPKNEFPYDPELYTTISGFYYEKSDYARAADFGRQALGLAPYVATYWENLGLELQQEHQDSDAVHAYRQALYYDATNYSAREHLRDLEKKPSLWKAFPETDIYKAIKDSAGKTYDYDYCYLLDEKFAIVYAEGATEEYTTLAVRIVNQKGIDDWKEYNIGYNSNTQVLKIEKAEVVKKNGSVMPAEQNDNQIVFTGLEAGDAIVVKFKIQNYADGRVTRHYWDRFGFSGFEPEDTSRYCLLVSNKVKFDYKMDNTTLKPRQTPYDDFTLYTWEMVNPAVVKDEPFMPPSMDVGPTVSVSTLDSWQDISGWYSDLATSKTDDEYEVKTVFGNLFPQGTDKLSDREKAFRIYTYITGNIHYSSVSFRQGAFVPQKASVTINTRLGDCKDLSSLFVSLARLSGLKANLVLVNTRDNGLKSMELPSLEFNHCIVKTWIDGKAYFLELTDNNLPFASLPTSLMHATCLVIPTGEAAIARDTAVAGNAKLEFVESPLRPRDKSIRRVDLHVEGSNLMMGVDVCRTGALVSTIRDDFSELSAEKQLEKMQNMVSGDFKNTVKVDGVSFKGLKESGDSAGYSYHATVNNEVVEVGEMHMIKIPFTDVVATVDDFSKDDRQFPVEYWRYENADEYDTRITVEAPVGKHFIELPKSETYTFRNSTYSLQYIPSGTRKLTIIRKVTLQRDDVMPSEYKAMKDFFGKIVKAESKYIVYK